MATNESSSVNQSRWTKAWNILGPFVGVLIGSGITLLTVNQQIQAGQTAEQRVLRADTYQALIDAADIYANATDALMADQGEVGDVSARRIAELRSERAVSTWLSARFDFQTAVNRAYVYGSGEGWAATQALVETMPNPRGDNYEFEPVGLQHEASYNHLLELMCREASIEPRKDCSAPN